MQISYNEAKSIAGFILADFERERPATLHVLESIPSDKQDYAPDPMSRSAIQLAFHLVSSEWYFLETIVQGIPPAQHPEFPASIHSAQDVAAWEKSRIPEQIDRVKSLSGEQLSRTLVFGEKMKLPAYAALTLMLKHSIHHRGQLAAYLRPMGATVPSIYGPSADTK